MFYAFLWFLSTRLNLLQNFQNLVICKIKTIQKSKTCCQRNQICVKINPLKVHKLQVNFPFF